VTQRQPIPADGIRTIPMGWIWASVFVVVAVFGLAITPWDAIGSLIQSEGVGENEASLIGFVAGYTAPLTAGLAFLAWLYVSGTARGMSGQIAGLTIGGVLFATGLASAYLGLGQLPNYDARVPSGPPWVSIPEWVLQGYVNSYGWSLTIASAAIAVGLAIQVERPMYIAPEAAP
jgi:hypothetical protein